MENTPRIQKEYLMISPYDLVRSAEHTEAFFSPEEIIYEGTFESYQTFGRIKPVYFINRLENDETINAVIDGHKYVTFAQQNGIPQIFACKLTLQNEEDLPRIMIELQRSNHDTLIALFKMITVLWSIYSVGQGFRSDRQLENSNQPQAEERKPDVYERIGKVLNISGTKVKHIRKVGMINPAHFERIETSRFTLYAAYLECLKEERGEMPEPPSVNKPTYYTNQSTEQPIYSEPTSTEYTSPADPDKFQTVSVSEGEDNATTPIQTKENNDERPSTEDNDAENAFQNNESAQKEEVGDNCIVVSGVCQCCGQVTSIKINRNDFQ